MSRMTDVYLWIVFNGDDSQFFGSTVDEAPMNMREFVTEDSTVVKLSPQDVEQIAFVWAEAQGSQ